MKILSLHCDYLKFKPLKKALKSINDLTQKERELVEVKEPLGIFIAVEKKDESAGVKKTSEELVKNALDLMDKTKAKKIVLYPYAHLSSDLASPDFAKDVLENAEKELKKKNIETYRAPFDITKNLN